MSGGGVDGVLGRSKRLYAEERDEEDAREVVASRRRDPVSAARTFSRGGAGFVSVTWNGSRDRSKW